MPEGQTISLCLCNTLIQFITIVVLTNYNIIIQHEPLTGVH